MGPSTEQVLGERAREMRKNPTEWEKRLWRHLSNSQLGAFKFRGQAVIGTTIADFFCPSIGLIVEIDGDTHDPEKDARRDRWMKQFGLTVYRVTNGDVRENVGGVLEGILARAQSLPPRSAWRLPHPNPSPEGEGL